MSIIDRLKKPARKASAPKKARKSPETSPAQRKVYAAVRQHLENGLAQALKSTRSLVIAEMKGQPKASVQDWLDIVVGDAVTDTIEEVNKDMPDIADALQEEEDEEPKAEAEEPMPEEIPVEEPPAAEDESEEIPAEEPPAAEDEEEEEEEPKESEGVVEKEMEAVAADLKQIKAKLVKQAQRIAKAKDPDTAALLRMVADQL